MRARSRRKVRAQKERKTNALFECFYSWSAARQFYRYICDGRYFCSITYLPGLRVLISAFDEGIGDGATVGEAMIQSQPRLTSPSQRYGNSNLNELLT